MVQPRWKQLLNLSWAVPIFLILIVVLTAVPIRLVRLIVLPTAGVELKIGAATLEPVQLMV